MVLNRYIFQFFFMAFLQSCLGNIDYCIEDISIKRYDTPNPDGVELTLHISNQELLEKVINGEFKMLKVNKLYGGNLKYLFPIRDEDIYDGSTFKLFFETSYFYSNKGEFKDMVDEYLENAEVLIIFENGEILNLTKCK
jgi:hypothetical protein